MPPLRYSPRALRLRPLAGVDPRLALCSILIALLSFAPFAQAKTHAEPGKGAPSGAAAKAKPLSVNPTRGAGKVKPQKAKAMGGPVKVNRQTASAPALSKTTADSAQPSKGKSFKGAAKGKSGSGSSKRVSAAAAAAPAPRAPAPAIGTASSAPATTPSAGAPPAAPQQAQPTSSRERRAARRAAARRRSARRAIPNRAGSDSPRAAAVSSLASTTPLFTSGSPAVAPVAAGAAGRPSGAESSRESPPSEREDSPSTVTRTVRDIVEVVPGPLKAGLVGLALLAAVLAAGYLLAAVRARRLARQRADLLQDVGLLQTALLPPVPAVVGALRTSVAYRPSEGPGAGGDFYDALPLPGGKAAFILGDVCGHGRQALAHTAFVRYTLRAYLEAGLDPGRALQVAGPVIDQHLGGSFATVILAVHDPAGGSLTYACAGHHAPIVAGSDRVEPVLAGSAPPVGLSLRTGIRQTTVPLPPGSVVCLYTDGLPEARTRDGILGRARLADILEELGRDATAEALIERVAQEARLVTDDMATVVLSPTAGVTAGGFREERLEVDLAEVLDGLADDFLEACGVSAADRSAAAAEAERVATAHSAAVLQVRFGTRGPIVGVLPRSVESLAEASRSGTAA